MYGSSYGAGVGRDNVSPNWRPVALIILMSQNVEGLIIDSHG